jgi:hypothetical protein
LGCLLFRLFRARLCSFRSSDFPLAHSLLFRSPLLAPLASAFPRSLLFPLASARLSALSTRLCFSDACFSTLAFDSFVPPPALPGTIALDTAVSRTMQRLLSLRASCGVHGASHSLLSITSRIGRVQFSTKHPGMVLPAATACCCCFSCWLLLLLLLLSLLWLWSKLKLPCCPFRFRHADLSNYSFHHSRLHKSPLPSSCLDLCLCRFVPDVFFVLFFPPHLAPLYFPS